MTWLDRSARVVKQADGLGQLGALSIHHRLFPSRGPMFPAMLARLGHHPVGAEREGAPGKLTVERVKPLEPHAPTLDHANHSHESQLLGSALSENWFIRELAEMVCPPYGGLSSVVDAGLAEQTLDVNFHCRFGDTQLARYMLIGSALHQLHQDHLFSVRQPREISALRRVICGAWLCAPRASLHQLGHGWCIIQQRHPIL